MNYLDRYKDRKQYYHTKSGSFVGMMMDYVLYGCSINDYFMYRFYEKSHAEKSGYITCKKHQLIQRIENKDEYVSCFENKAKFNTLFREFIKRDWLDLDMATIDEIDAFMGKHPIFFLKDKTDCEGKGVQRISDGSMSSTVLKQEWGGHIIEEAVLPCHELAEFCPDSLNTLRITALKNQHTKEFEIMSAVLRLSTGSVLDNLFQGALVADVDLKTGIVATNGMSRIGEDYEYHPISGKRIAGFQIPCWEELVDMVHRMNTVVPDIGYVGWDVGITHDRGVLVIEGNNCADHDVPQIAKRRGIWPEFKERLM